MIALLLVPSLSLAQVEVEGGWARPTPPTAQVAAGYAVVRNRGIDSDRLVSAASPIAERVELHQMTHDGGIMRMRQIDGVLVPAKGVITLEPGGIHLMLINIKHPLKVGESVPVTLRFERAGERQTTLQVRLTR